PESFLLLPHAASTVPASSTPTPNTTAGRLIIATRMETPRFSLVVRYQVPQEPGTVGRSGCQGRPHRGRRVGTVDLRITMAWRRLLTAPAGPPVGRQALRLSGVVCFTATIVRALSRGAVERRTGQSSMSIGGL